MQAVFWTKSEYLYRPASRRSVGTLVCVHLPKCLFMKCVFKPFAELAYQQQSVFLELKTKGTKILKEHKQNSIYLP